MPGLNCLFAYTMSNDTTLAGTGNTTEVPTFVNPSGDDYHLAPSSAGIDLGDPARTGGTDIDGEARPRGARSDIGADEVR